MQCPGLQKIRGVSFFCLTFLKILIPLALCVQESIIHNPTAVLNLKNGIRSNGMKLINICKKLQRRRENAKKKKKKKIEGIFFFFFFLISGVF